jgi:NIMA-interacting peptidyl-prolyl cis-trans isomerase 1
MYIVHSPGLSSKLGDDVKIEFALHTGQHYYLNIYTKESQWDRPEKPAEPVSSSGPDQVQCSHLLVKHQNSRRPSSWREEEITRTKEEALDLVKCKSSSVFSNIFSSHFL